MSQEINTAGNVDVNDFVELKRSDLKDAKKKNKIKGIVLYSIQEALKIANTTSVTHETFKDEQLRKMIIQIIEG